MNAATPKGAPQRIDAPEAYSKTPNCPAVPRKGPWSGERSYLQFSWFWC